MLAQPRSVWTVTRQFDFAIAGEHSVLGISQRSHYVVRQPTSHQVDHAGHRRGAVFAQLLPNLWGKRRDLNFNFVEVRTANECRDMSRSDFKMCDRSIASVRATSGQAVAEITVD